MFKEHQEAEVVLKKIEIALCNSRMQCVKLTLPPLPPLWSAAMVTATIGWKEGPYMRTCREEDAASGVREDFSHSVKQQITRIMI